VCPTRFINQGQRAGGGLRGEVAGRLIGQNQARPPRLILADEPTGNLDPQTAARALALIDEQVREHGIALLMVTHSEQAAAIAQRRLRLSPSGLSDEP